MGIRIVIIALIFVSFSAIADSWERYHQVVHTGGKKIVISGQYRIHPWPSRWAGYASDAPFADGDGVRAADGALTIETFVPDGPRWVLRSVRQVTVHSAALVPSPMVSLYGNLYRSTIAEEVGTEVRLTEAPQEQWIRLAAEVASAEFLGHVFRCGRYLEVPRYLSEPWRMRRGQRF